MAAATALLVTSCSATSGGGSDESQSNGKHLTVWFPGNNPADIKEVTKTLVPRYEKEKGVSIDVSFYDYSNLSTKLNAAFAGGTAPDVFGHGPAAVADLVHNGRLQVLTKQMKSISAADQKDLAPVLSGGQVNGKQYMIPLSVTGSLIVYDKKAFEAAGLDPDSPPSTWEGVYNDAEKLTTRDSSGHITRSGLLIGSQPVGRQQSFSTLLSSAGGHLLNDSGTKATFDSKAGLKALNYFVKTYNGKDAVAANLGDDFADVAPAQQPLATGDAAMSVLSSQATSALIAAKPDLDLGVIQPPTLGSGKTGGVVGGAGPGLMINKDSKNKALGWDFIEWMTSKQISTEYTAAVGAVPPRTSADSSDYVKKSEVVQAWSKVGSKWVPNPNVPGWVQARDTMDKYLEQALNKTLSPKDTLEQMTSAVDGVLDSSR